MKTSSAYRDLPPDYEKRDFVNPYCQFEIKGEQVVDFDDGAALAILFDEEIVFVNSPWYRTDFPEEARKRANIHVICNDIFAWACSDAETLDMADIQDLYNHWLDDRSWGVALWCCKKRGDMPQAPVADAMRKAGIDIDSLGLMPNGYDEACRKAAQERRNDCGS